MAVVVLTDPPWTLPFTPFPRDKLILIANSSVDWSYRTCQYYCSVRGIPEANILQVAMGNGGAADLPPSYWNGNRATYNTLLTQPLRTLMISLRAVAMIIGPGCPSNILYEWYTGGFGFIGLEELVGCTLQFVDGDLTNYRAGGAGGDNSLRRLTDVDHNQNMIYITSWPACLAEFEGQFSAAYGIQYQIPDWTDTSWVGTVAHIVVPPADKTALVANGNMHDTVYNPTSSAARAGYPHFPIGRLGFASWGGGFAGGPPIPETEQRVLQIINDTTRAMSEHNVYEARLKPMLFNLAGNAQDGGINSKEGWSSLCNLANHWGMNTLYGYFDVATSTTLVQEKTPLVNAKYNQAKILTNEVEQEFYFMVGVWSNFDPAPATIYSPPYSTSWKPMLGASAIMGPSDGFQYVQNALTRGASAGMIDYGHVTSGTEVRAFGFWHSILRGMSWLEASAYFRFRGTIAAGDPLWAPYALTKEVFDMSARYNDPPTEIFGARGGTTINVSGGNHVVSGRAIYVGGTGDVSVLAQNGETLTYKNVPVGAHLIVSFTTVFQSGTTATDLLALR